MIHLSSNTMDNSFDHNNEVLNPPSFFTQTKKEETNQYKSFFYKFDKGFKDNFTLLVLSYFNGSDLFHIFAKLDKKLRAAIPKAGLLDQNKVLRVKQDAGIKDLIRNITYGIQLADTIELVFDNSYENFGEVQILVKQTIFTAACSQGLKIKLHIEEAGKLEMKFIKNLVECQNNEIACTSSSSYETKFIPHVEASNYFITKTNAISFRNCSKVFRDTLEFEELNDNYDNLKSIQIHSGYTDQLDSQDQLKKVNVKLKKCLSQSIELINLKLESTGIDELLQIMSEEDSIFYSKMKPVHINLWVKKFYLSVEFQHNIFKRKKQSFNKYYKVQSDEMKFNDGQEWIDENSITLGLYQKQFPCQTEIKREINRQNCYEKVKSVVLSFYPKATNKKLPTITLTITGQITY